MPIPLAAAAIGGIASLGSAIFGSKSASKAAKAQQAALDFEKEKWSQGAAFRNAGTEMLGRKLNPDAITNAYADPGNPYAAGNTYQSPWQEQAPSVAPAPKAPVVNSWLPRRALTDIQTAVRGQGDPQTGDDAGRAMMTRRARLEAMAGLLGRREPMR